MSQTEGQSGAVEVRPLRGEDEFRQAVFLADQTFRSAGQTSMGTAFAASFSPELGQSVGALVDGELVSFMGLVPAVIHAGPAAIGAYMLGQVCTAPQARGRGYASRVMECVLEQIRQSEAALMLVSGARSLYERHACLPFGRMRQIVAGREWAEALQAAGDAAGGSKIRPGCSADWLGLKRCADTRPVRFEYSAHDLARFVAAQARPSCMKHEQRLLVAESGDGGIVAFLVFTAPDPNFGEAAAGRTAEAIEWAGPAEAVAALVAHAIGACGLPLLKLLVPEHESGMLAQFSGMSMASQPYPSTIHIVDAARLIRQLAPRFGTPRAAEALATAAEQLPDGSVKVCTDGREYRLSAQEWIDEIFTGRGEMSVLGQLLPSVEMAMPVPLPSPHGLMYV